MTRPEAPTFVVIEPAAGVSIDPHHLDRAARELTTPGAVIVSGWNPSVVPTSGRGPAPVCTGVVSTQGDAAAAILAAVAGARLAVLLTASRDVADRFCDDLRHLGVLDHRVGDSGYVLSDEQRALLSCLLTGMTLGDAAAALHLSRRTADRRLAAARRALGVGSTAEALQAALRRGVRPTTQ